MSEDVDRGTRRKSSILRNGRNRVPTNYRQRFSSVVGRLHSLSGPTSGFALTSSLAWLRYRAAIVIISSSGFAAGIYEIVVGAMK